MAVIIELSPEIEASLAALAQEQHLSLPEYLQRVLGGMGKVNSPLSSSERAEAWREAAKGLPRTRPLSDEAISRESIYGYRG